jgi:hypothetical protein
MIGTWRSNAIVAGSIGPLIFLLSISSNPLSTALYRAGSSFVISFAVMFAVRWLIGQALTSGAPHDTMAEEQADRGHTQAASEEGKGQSIDLTTPDGAWEDQPIFAPLSPPRLKKTEDPLDPEQLAKAIRHMSQK